MIKANDLFLKVEEHIRSLFQQNVKAQHLYHTLAHTEEVVTISRDLAQAEGLDKKEQEILILAAWFHATGYLLSYPDAIAASAELAEAYLSEQGYPAADIAQVQALILGTEQAPTPGQISAEILHDAINSDLGRKRFFRRKILLRTEREHFLDEHMDDPTWEKKMLGWLTGTRFYSEAAKKNYSRRRADNLDQQRSLLQTVARKSVRDKTGKEFGRGIDTMYRASYRNHINLSSIADGKANMMISINTLILSGVITLVGLGGALTDYGMNNIQYVVPLLSMLIFSLGSIVVAIISARPKVTKQNFGQTWDLYTTRKSVLFFGNFVNLTLEDFIGKLHQLKDDQALVYDNMAIDLYYLGLVLDKKYRLVRLSYNIFMVGLIVSVMVFLVAIGQSLISGQPAFLQ